MRFLFMVLFSFSILFGNEVSEKTKSITEELIAQAPTKPNNYIDYEKWHENSGYITLGLLGATVLTTWNEDIHTGFGIASAVGMATTTAFGVIAHKDEVFDLSKGWKKEHWHSLLGAIGTVAILMSVSQAPEDSHAGLGMLGGISAGISYAIVEW